MKLSKIQALLLSGILLIAGCSTSTEIADTEVHFEAAEIVSEDEKAVVIEALENLESFGTALEQMKKEDLIDFTATEDSMGLYITEVNGLKADSEKKTYWAFYTNLLEQDGHRYADMESGSYTYGHKELGYASYGVSGVPFVKGYFYALVYETY